MDSGKQLLELKNLSIGYQRKELVNGVDISAEKGRFILLLGANGKGKSTLLKTISGFIPPVNGQVFIHGKDVDKAAPKIIARMISFLPGNIAVPNEVTVLDMLQYARIPYLTGMRNLSKEDHELIEEVVREINVSELLDSFYMTLSDGQKQLVNIARSLVQQTSIIALDEPTAHLDIVNKRKVLQLLKDQSQKGKLVICSTHDLSEGCKFADEVWLINKTGDFESFKNVKSLDVQGIEDRLF